MELAPTIDVALVCSGWRAACPSAEDLARRAAALALARGAAACGLMWRGAVELGIVLADADEQRRLNHRYRGRDAPTNVLAFPAWEREEAPAPPGAPVLLGDVVVALEIVTQEAAEQAKPVTDHLQHLIVHGVLHLLGYDHLAEADAIAMEALESSVLAQLGVSDPYRGPISSPAASPLVQP